MAFCLLINLALVQPFSPLFLASESAYFGDMRKEKKRVDLTQLEISLFTSESI